MSARLTTADRIVAQFLPPTAGVNTVLPAHQVPPNALVDASNVFVRYGILRQRPGFNTFLDNSFNLKGVPTGTYNYVNTNKVHKPIIATYSNIYTYSRNNWVDNSPSFPMIGEPDNQARFTSIALGTPPVNFALMVNGADPMLQWADVGPFIPVSGIPSDRPNAVDVISISDHIMTLNPPYGIYWSNIRDITKWPDLNSKQAAETVDHVISLATIGQGNYAILYKERSIWGINYTGAPNEAAAFSFNLIGFFDGPASPYAVVGVNGGHVYMTPTGRIALFNGVNHQWIGDGIWPTLRERVTTSSSGLIVGVYNPSVHEVTFYFPDNNNDGKMTGIVHITLPLPAANYNDIGIYPGTIMSEINAAGTIRLDDNIDRVLIAGARPYEWTVDATSDNGDPFSGFWQTGLTAIGALNMLRLEGFEILADRGTGYGAVNIRPVTSFTLNGNGDIGTAIMGDAGNLEKVDEPVKAVTGLNDRTRFFGIRGEFPRSDTVTLRYKGANIYGLKVTR